MEEKKNQKQRIQGIWAAMMTPYDREGRVSTDDVRRFMEFYLEKKLDGIFPVSNVGEFATLPFEEKCRVIEICTQMGRGSMMVCPGVTDLNLDRAVELAQFSKSQGADGVILSTPFYYPYGREYVEEYMRVFLEKSPLPVLIYHSPRFANAISLPFLMELLKHPKTIGVKESSGDVKFLLTLLERVQKEGAAVDVMVGFEELLLTGLVHGASGCITSCGGIVPEILQRILRCFQEQRLAEASAYQKSICRITEVLSSYGFPYGYKMGMHARVPHKILQAESMCELEKMLQEKSAEIKAVLERELKLL